jgi:hypothetical protein
MRMTVGRLKKEKICNCGKRATWWVFLINGRGDRSIYYKCERCITQIIDVINSMERENHYVQNNTLH